jgi:hypothetical protein
MASESNDIEVGTKPKSRSKSRDASRSQDDRVLFEPHEAGNRGTVAEALRTSWSKHARWSEREVEDLGAIPSPS